MKISRTLATVLIGTLATLPLPSLAFQPYQGTSQDGFIVGMEHNGSSMWVSDDLSIIYYDRPKAALAGTVAPGMVLYQGDPIPKVEGQRISGTAYTFRKGCAPAPYAVTGELRGNLLTLRGASPRREQNGCAVIGYTQDSGNAVLVFQYNYGDI